MITLPNLLTLGRLAAVPVVAYLLLTREPLACITALGVFGLAALTDAYDGRLARARNEVTPFGAFLDPLADKVMVLTLFGVFVALGFIAWWMYAVIAGREVVVTVARWRWFREGADVSAQTLGKHKTGWQIAALLVMMTILALQTVRNSLEGSWRVLADERALTGLSWASTATMWVVVALSVVSGVQFFLHRPRV